MLVLMENNIGTYLFLGVPKGGLNLSLVDFTHTSM